MSVGDIIVTAQKRGERLQDVPIAVTALEATGLAKQGITSTADLTLVTPGLNFAQNASYAQPTIRGVGSLSTAVGDENSVSTYIDGVYVPQMLGNFHDFVDVDHIEVLKGPQGTLFGRNATGGAILITTLAPSFTPTGKFEASYGRFNELMLKGFGSAGLSNNVAFSLSGFYGERDGFYRNIVTNRTDGGYKKYGLRAKLLLNAGDRFSATLSADYSHSTDPAGLLTAPIGGNSIAGLFGAPLPTKPYERVSDTIPSQTARQYGFSANLRYEADGFDIVSITGFRDNKTRIVIDFDGSSLPLATILNVDHTRNFSQELQLVSTSEGPLKWIVGGYYFHSRGVFDPLQVNQQGRAPSVVLVDHRDNSFAGFADATYKLGKISITGGIRYSYEKKQYDGSANGFTVINDARKSWQSLTPRAILSYAPTSNFLAYASYSKGFKSGVFNTPSLVAAPVNPEKIDAYEIGVKASPSRAISINASAFHYKISDLQVQILDPATNVTRLENAATGRINGADLDVSLRPVSDLSVRFGLSYLDAKYSSYPNALVFIPNPATGGLGSITVRRDVSGNRIIRTPEITVNAGVDYTIRLANGGTLTPAANIFMSGDYFFDALSTLRQPSYVKVNAQLTWAAPGDRLSVQLWGKNLTNAIVLQTISANALGVRGSYYDPRTYGVRLGYKF